MFSSFNWFSGMVVLLEQKSCWTWMPARQPSRPLSLSLPVAWGDGRMNGSKNTHQKVITEWTNITWRCHHFFHAKTGFSVLSTLHLNRLYWGGVAKHCRFTGKKRTLQFVRYGQLGFPSPEDTRMHTWAARFHEHEAPSSSVSAPRSELWEQALAQCSWAWARASARQDCATGWTFCSACDRNWKCTCITVKKHRPSTWNDRDHVYSEICWLLYFLLCVP